MTETTPTLAASKKRKRKPQPPPVWQVPRACEYCATDYVPRTKTQRWCKGCAPDKATQERLRRYGRPEPTTESAIAKATGVRTSTCRTCDRRFTYDYIGGSPRTTCDEHRPAPYAKVSKLARSNRPTCLACDRLVIVVDENGLCRRDSPHERVEVACGYCRTAFRTSWSRPSVFCSSDCRATSRKEASELLRRCGLCEGPLASRHNKQRYCSDCVSTKADAARARLYGISKTDFAELKAKFSGLCWICRDSRGECVDHCHETGRVRGWLCKKCNHLLHYVERIDWLNSAVAYLR